MKFKAGLCTIEESEFIGAMVQGWFCIKRSWETKRRLIWLLTGAEDMRSEEGAGEREGKGGGREGEEDAARASARGNRMGAAKPMAQ
mmetsp:Transcript_25909/g.85306  ORF Transcript_25909/g.85306 Transcript_25909/m.85306 type:complete len:87 (+) Transcript_25909:522-782(+)